MFNWSDVRREWEKFVIGLNNVHLSTRGKLPVERLNNELTYEDESYPDGPSVIGHDITQSYLTRWFPLSWFFPAKQVADPTDPDAAAVSVGPVDPWTLTQEIQAAWLDVPGLIIEKTDGAGGTVFVEAEIPYSVDGLTGNDVRFRLYVDNHTTNQAISYPPTTGTGGAGGPVNLSGYYRLSPLRQNTIKVQVWSIGGTIHSTGGTLDMTPSSVDHERLHDLSSSDDHTGTLDTDLITPGSEGTILKTEAGVASWSPQVHYVKSYLTNGDPEFTELIRDGLGGFVYVIEELE